MLGRILPINMGTEPCNCIAFPCDCNGQVINADGTKFNTQYPSSGYWRSVDTNKQYMVGAAMPNGLYIDEWGGEHRVSNIQTLGDPDEVYTYDPVAPTYPNNSKPLTNWIDGDWGFPTRPNVINAYSNSPYVSGNGVLGNTIPNPNLGASGSTGTGIGATINGFFDSAASWAESNPLMALAAVGVVGYLAYSMLGGAGSGTYENVITRRKGF